MPNTSWKNNGSLAEARAGHASLVWNDRLYVFGGKSGAGISSAVSSVKSAPLSNDGKLGPWRVESPLPGNRVDLKVAMAANNIVYVSGGMDEAMADSNAVWYAQMSGDGKIGPWRTGTVMPASLSGHGFAAIGNHLVVVGGMTAGAPVAPSYVARVNSDGSMGPWLAGPSVPTALGLHALAVEGDYLYLVGGISDAALTSSSIVYKSQLNPSGVLSSWQNVGALSAPRCGHAAVVLNGVLYAIGGMLSASQANLAGTATFTQGSAAVLGVGTAFNTALQPGDLIRPNGTSVWYTVLSVADALNLTLTENFLGTTAAGATVNHNRPSNLSTIQAINVASGVASKVVVATPINTALRGIGVAVDDGEGFIYVTGGETGIAAVSTVQVGNATESNGSIG